MGYGMPNMFDSIVLGGNVLPNRIAMAPMTRSRAEPDGTPGPLAAEYYAQRAGVGLIIAEGTQPCADGQGYLSTPGIYTQAHVAGWRRVSDAVHARGGHLFIQLMHVGRMSHPDNTPHHRKGVAPSAIAPGTQIATPDGMQDVPVPRALELEDIKEIVKDFRHAARCAVEAGADGVEIHAANAYLIHQFLGVSSNTRTDEYGGSIENRARFAIEIAQAIADEIGPERTAIRISPGMNLWGIDEGWEGVDLYLYLVEELNRLGLAYLHVLHLGDDELVGEMREIWQSRLIINRPGRERDMIGKDIESGLADMESYGALVIANPDFVERLQQGTFLNDADAATYFGGNEKGYTDYPVLSEAVA